MNNLSKIHFSAIVFSVALIASIILSLRTNHLPDPPIAKQSLTKSSSQSAPPEILDKKKTYLANNSTLAQGIKLQNFEPAPTNIEDISEHNTAPEIETESIDLIHQKYFDTEKAYSSEEISVGAYEKENIIFELIDSSSKLSEFATREIQCRNTVCKLSFVIEDNNQSLELTEAFLTILLNEHPNVSIEIQNTNPDENGETHFYISGLK